MAKHKTEDLFKSSNERNRTPSDKRTVRRHSRKELTPTQTFNAKNKYLSERFQELTPAEFYKAVFPPETLEKKGDDSYRSSNPIFSFKVKKDNRTYFQNEIVFADTFDESLKKTEKNDLALCAMITYSGRRKSAKNAYKCVGFCIDLDGVGLEELECLFGQIEWLETLPWPTYISNSGHGLHIYYIFQVPVPLYPQVVGHLQNLKRGLTEIVWNRETSTYKPKERQYQGIYQSFRMPGSRTKLGKETSRNRYLVRVWKIGKPCSLEYLNSFVDKKYQCPVNPDYSSWDWANEGHYTLEECRLLYPEWYQKRIIEGKSADHWPCNKGLYDWWLDKIQEGQNAHDGNRFHCISFLYVYGRKCDVPKSLIDADAMELLEPFNERTVKEGNNFTIEDIKSASAFYDNRFTKMSRAWIEHKSEIPIPPARRNGRPQKLHVRLMSATRDVLYPDGEWRNKEGRPDKQAVVREWREANPYGRKADCIRETGLDKKTVYKWWDT